MCNHSELGLLFRFIQSYNSILYNLGLLDKTNLSVCKKPGDIHTHTIIQFNLVQSRSVRQTNLSVCSKPGGIHTTYIQRINCAIIQGSVFYSNSHKSRSIRPIQFTQFMVPYLLTSYFIFFRFYLIFLITLFLTH